MTLDRTTGRSVHAAARAHRRWAAGRALIAALVAAAVSAPVLALHGFGRYGRSEPAELEPSYAGHSIGHWDDDVLVE